MTEYRWATNEDYESLIEMANRAFHPEKHTEDFKKDTSPESFFPRILPKLYQNIGTAPMHYLAVQDGKIVGVVGNFDLPTMVAGEKLKVVGIGTVSTHPEHRREGHMIRLMNDSIAHAKETGADYLVLGGERQRYEHWGFGQAGVNPGFELNDWNFGRIFGKEASFGYEFRKLEKTDTEEIRASRRLRTSEETYVLHDEKQEYNILCSMGATPYLVKKDGAFAGTMMYFPSEHALGDLRFTEESEALYILNDFLKAMELPTLKVSRIPPDRTALLAVLSKYAEEGVLMPCEMIRVLNYERTIRAFLRMKCRIFRLPDEELRVHFDNGERLLIGVRDGAEEVQPIEDGPMDLEFENPTDAVNYFFGNLGFITDYGCEKRERTRLLRPAFLPLPYYQPACDEI